MYVWTAGTKAHCQTEEDKMIDEASMNDDNYEPDVEEEELGVEEDKHWDDENSGSNGEDEDGSQAGSSSQQGTAEKPPNSTQGVSGQKTKRKRKLLKDKVHTIVCENFIRKRFDF